jgi:RNA polymerase sigma-70 factor, ECF subfamily
LTRAPAHFFVDSLPNWQRAETALCQLGSRPAATAAICSVFSLMCTLAQALQSTLAEVAMRMAEVAHGVEVEERSALAASTARTDHRAFQRAVSPYRGTLRAQALRLTKNRSDAEDLLQEMMLRAWRYWPLYREQDNCRAWLQRIMLNTFCSQRRAYARKKRLLAGYALAQDAAVEATALGDPQGLLSQEQVSHSLSVLKPEQARILRLVDMDERSYREAAAELACPVGTVMSRLHRARRALRSLLADEAQAYA